MKDNPSGIRPIKKARRENKVHIPLHVVKDGVQTMGFPR